MTPTKIGLITAAALGGIFVLSTLFGSFYTIDQGERGVLLRNGAIVGTAQPGLGFKTPFIDSVVKIPVNQQVTHWNADYKLQAYSQDQQPADMIVSVLWHVPADKVAEVYAEYGSLDNLVGRLIGRKVPQDIKTVFGRFTAVTAIQKRDAFNAAAQAAIIEGVRGPIVIDGVQVENIDFSDSYEKAVEERMLAEVAVQKIKQQADQAQAQAQVTVTNAKAAADAKVAEATAEAQATKLRGDAEASAIKARGDALKQNPDLVALTAAERWDGKLPSTMVPGSSVPFVTVK
jgi:regulator of protease activity HflC (stomatin/prohibitin superfamily)